MAHAKITAPVDPAVQQKADLKQLAGKGSKRTAAEASKAIDLLAARVEALEARLDQQG